MNDHDPGSGQPTGLLDKLCLVAVNRMGLHAWVFALGNIVLHALNIWQGAPWWALWPLLAWGVPFSIHFFIYKSLTVNEDWADGRIDDMRWRAYDLGHIEDLEDRIRADDYSTRPAHRRAPQWWLTEEERLAKDTEKAHRQQQSGDDAP
ncbi:MAG: hypothetical protein GKR94_11235 [Gammaproteobacteria bacterium]|nr:hypothetical protein [Gammaproteobacteria bacterium]